MNIFMQGVHKFTSVTEANPLSKSIVTRVAARFSASTILAGGRRFHRGQHLGRPSHFRIWLMQKGGLGHLT